MISYVDTIMHGLIIIHIHPVFKIGQQFMAYSCNIFKSFIITVFSITIKVKIYEDHKRYSHHQCYEHSQLKLIWIDTFLILHIIVFLCFIFFPLWCVQLWGMSSKLQVTLIGHNCKEYEWKFWEFWIKLCNQFWSTIFHIERAYQNGQISHISNWS